MPPARPHLWFTISRHLTSTGVVSYQRCPCGRWRTLQNDETVTAGASTCLRLELVGSH